jgi:hypothetical protein
MQNSATLEEVEAIMAELGLAAEPIRQSTGPKPIAIQVNNTPANSSPQNSSPAPKGNISESEVDDLLKEIGATPTTGQQSVQVNAGGAQPNVRASSGPGRGRGSSGPGPGWKGRGGPSAGPGKAMDPPQKPMATHTPDGRPITHSGPPCAHCGEMILGQVLNAIGKTYHPNHFVCTHCNQPFPAGVFVEHEEKPYCEAHYNELFCPRCANCSQPITDKCVTAFGNKYHPQHFTCTGCGLNLVGKPYREDEGEIYCTTCKEARHIRKPPTGEICAKCKEPIFEFFIIIRGQKVHAEHFRCEECGKELRGGHCNEYEGNWYCTEDYLKLLRNTCASCNKPIHGRSLTALGRVWHPDHFVCSVCREPFSGTSFYEKDKKPYCEYHYTQLFGDPCAKCGRPVVTDAIEFLDKFYHREHFTCSGCEKVLKDKVCQWESKPMCGSCYMKLPSEVRKREEKKREAEKKIEKEREKEAKKASKGK